MPVWKDFELECTNYLNSQFGEYAGFFHEGEEDSTVPDIRVVTNSGEEFYIEAKHSPAQCGQFVLLPDIVSRSFVYSSRNDTAINIYAEQIMNHMNEQFDEFKEAGTAGRDIIMEDGEDIFSNWIIQNYRNKGVRYFITNNHTLFMVDRLKEYFNVTAKYRIKRSGSRGVGKSNIPMVLNYINNGSYCIQNTRNEGSKLFVKSDRELCNQRFILQEHEYMFSQRGVEYEIRQLSNTFNANVIFSVSLKASVQGLTSDEFIAALH
ncbi:MAG: hypothetical protein ACI4EQ_09535 [Lachnospiraceae bacterium]